MIPVIESRIGPTTAPARVYSKRTLTQSIGIVLTFCLLLTALAACTDGEKLSGKYELIDGDLMGITYTFYENGRVEVSGFNGDKKFRRSGFYSISDGMIEFTMSDGSRAICVFEKTDNSIILDGVEYKKVK